MASWNELLDAFDALPDAQQKVQWLKTKHHAVLSAISKLRQGRHVLFYASAFLQKPQAPAPTISITYEDINGFMSTMFGMDWGRNLTLLLHTPGGSANAAETIVSYLRSKFDDIEVIIPAFAMSAGTMISLAANHIVMGRQSQLGPIDPQFLLGGVALSARAVVDQFENARTDIMQNRDSAHLWAPVLQSIGPALLQESKNALEYGERMVSSSLERYMFKNASDPQATAKRTAAHFNDASKHKSHGRRIDRDEGRTQNLSIEDLEVNQQLQDEVLTAYHLATISFERSEGVKMIASDTGRLWVKNWGGLQV